MRLAHLTLTDFRNFASLQTHIPAGPTLLVGANAQGKTSLLEAIYYLVGASSPHTANDRELIRLESEPTIARLIAEFEGDSSAARPSSPRSSSEHSPTARLGAGSQRIEIRLILSNAEDGNGRLRKEILLNGVKRRAMDLHGRFNAVLFLPQDVQVVDGSPQQRRAQLDAVLSQADPDYARLLVEYGKVLTQRNALLKQIQERRANVGQLTFWDERLAALGSEVMLARAASIAQLGTLAAPIHLELTAKAEMLSLVYRPAYSPSGAYEEGAWLTGALREGIQRELERLRQDELRRGITLTGPQRDDFSLRVNGFELRNYGSRGQNRTAMLAFKLAQVEWLHQRTRREPLLLLDEVVAELDPERRSYLLQRLSSAPQALITAADASMFTEEFLASATVWEIQAGEILMRQAS